jgi:hypothetical protein
MGVEIEREREREREREESDIVRPLTACRRLLLDASSVVVVALAVADIVRTRFYS